MCMCVCEKLLLVLTTSKVCLRVKTQIRTGFCFWMGIRSTKVLTKIEVKMSVCEDVKSYKAL